MNRIFACCAILVLLLIGPFLAEARSNGAPTCVGGESAPQGPHRVSDFTESTLPAGGFEVSVGGLDVSPGTPIQVETGVMYEVVISRPSNSFRGVMTRMGGGENGVDTSAVFSLADDQTDLKPNAFCDADVGGITHTDATDKLVISFFVEFSDASSNMPWDINVVESVIPSVFYYSQYTVNALPSIQEYVEGAGLSALSTAIDAAALDFDSFTNVTFFAPNTDALLSLADSFSSLASAIFTDSGWLLHLQALLLAHVYQGTLFTSDFVSGQTLIMLEGAEVTVDVDEAITLTPSLGPGGATILDENLTTTQGVIHVVDGLLFPSFLAQSIADVIQTEIPTLFSLLAETGLDETLDTSFGFTLFAPNEEALGMLDLDSDQDRESLIRLLQYHVVPLVLPSSSFDPEETYDIVTTTGDSIFVSFSFGDLLIDDAVVIQPDILANNGIIYIIDFVLEPPPLPDVTSSPTSSPGGQIPDSPTMQPTGDDSLPDLNATATPSMMPHNTTTPTSAPNSTLSTRAPTLAPNTAAPTAVVPNTTAPTIALNGTTTSPTVFIPNATEAPTVVISNTTAPTIAPNGTTTSPTVFAPNATEAPTLVISNTTAPTIALNGTTTSPTVFAPKATEAPTAVISNTTAPTIALNGTTTSPTVFAPNATEAPTAVISNTTAPTIAPNGTTTSPTVFAPNATEAPTAVISKTTAPTIAPNGTTTLPTVFVPNATEAPTMDNTTAPTFLPVSPNVTTESPTKTPILITPSPTMPANEVPTAQPVITSSPTVVSNVTTDAPTGEPTTFPTRAPSSTEFPTSDPAMARLSLVEVIAQTFALQTLEGYLSISSIMDEFTGPGPFTFMTPWDGAFLKMDPSWTNKLQNETWNAHLQDLLRYHVHDGDLPISSLPLSSSIVMKNGESVTMTRLEGTIRVRVNGILSIAPYDATNGFAYMVDEVLSPGWMSRSLLDVASETASLSTLASLIEIAELEQILSDSEGFVTVLAPSNDAFVDLGQDAVDFLLSDPGMPLLQETLLYHIIVREDGPYPSLLFDSSPLKTLAGEETVVISPGNPATVQGKATTATVLMADQVAVNGVAHVLDKVLLLDNNL